MDDERFNFDVVPFAIKGCLETCPKDHIPETNIDNLVKSYDHNDNANMPCSLS